MVPGRCQQSRSASIRALVFHQGNTDCHLRHQIRRREILSGTFPEQQFEHADAYFPVSIGLLDKETGEEVVPTTVLELKEKSQTFHFEVKGDVVPSILRVFSAPVKLVPVSGEVDETDLAFLAARDSDGFNKWDRSICTEIMSTHSSQQILRPKRAPTWDTLWLTRLFW